MSRWLALSLLGCLFLAGCSGSSTTSTPPTSATESIRPPGGHRAPE